MNGGKTVIRMVNLAFNNYVTESEVECEKRSELPYVKFGRKEHLKMAEKREFPLFNQ